MAKLLYTATMSLDGFIAGPGGDMSWLTRYMGSEDALAAELPGRVGSILVGRRTWGGDDPNRHGEGEEGPFGGAWHGQQFVVTHRPPDVAPPDTHFETDLAAAIGKARAAAGEKYVAILGAEVARGCLDLGELDELLVFLVPLMLGDGIRLFEHPGGTEVELERISAEAESDFAHLWYRVPR
jgi:dihydrofolate reductase